MSITDKLNKDLLKTKKKFTKANEKAVKVYKKLNEQCYVARSKPLADLLLAEIDAYTRLTVSANDYFKMQAIYTRRYNELNNRIIKSSTNVDVDDLQKMYALSNTIPINNSMKIYVNAISRDYKDWKSVHKMLVKLSFDMVVDNIPVISDIKSVVDQITQAINIFKEYKKDGTEYSKLDKELYKIEIHTAIMNNAEQLFLYQSNVLKESVEFLNQDPQEYYNEIIKEQNHVYRA